MRTQKFLAIEPDDVSHFETWTREFHASRIGGCTNKELTIKNRVL
jgi:hypothetical protein